MLAVESTFLVSDRDFGDIWVMLAYYLSCEQDSGSILQQYAEAHFMHVIIVFFDLYMRCTSLVLLEYLTWQYCVFYMVVISFFANPDGCYSVSKQEYDITSTHP